MNLRLLPSRGRKAVLLIVLMVAMWMAGALGLVHRTLHVAGLPQPSTLSDAGAIANGTQAAHGAHHGLSALFGQHQDADCRLYDQLAHGAAAPSVPMIVLPLVLPATVFVYLEGLARARWAALFDARGPPATR